MTAFTSLVDFRAFQRIDKFTAENDKFVEFRHDFESAAAMAQMDDVVDSALIEAEAAIMNTAAWGDETKQKSKAIYTLLMQLAAGGKAKQIVRGTPDRNGLMAWKRIISEYEPQVGNRWTGMLGGLLDPRTDGLAWKEQCAKSRAFGDLLLETQLGFELQL